MGKSRDQKRKRFFFFMFSLLSFLSSVLCAFCFSEESHPVLELQVKGTIDPAVARYVTRGLEEARRLQASVVVVELDTPGGLDGSMRKMVQGILNSPVPVVVYVSPSGARAASAGLFLAYAAHIAAMAPGTNIGAAHPVQLGMDSDGVSTRSDRPSVMEEKLTNDAVAYLRSIAEIRGRNIEWSEKFVRESRSLSAEEAKERKVIDLIAPNLESLLDQIQGWEVKTVFGATTLEIRGQPRHTVPSSFLEKGLHQLAHPNLAYILFLLGIYGLIYELATPGALFPGVLGAISLILALAALETLEVNWAGLLLIILSTLFFIADIKLPGYGALTIGGILSFLLGSAFLFPVTRIPHLQLPWGTIGIATGVTAIFFAFVVGAGIRALRRKVTTGIEGLIGSEGVAKTDLKLEGLVHVRGEAWQAKAEHPIGKGMRIKVVRLEGLTVHVEPVTSPLFQSDV